MSSDEWIGIQEKFIAKFGHEGGIDAMKLAKVRLFLRHNIPALESVMSLTKQQDRELLKYLREEYQNENHKTN